MSESFCKNNRGHQGCQEVVVDGGEEDSGYCEKCFWPGIAEANAKYAQLLTEGHSRVDAAELSGLNDGERHHKYGTTMIDSPQQDSNFTDCDDPEGEEDPDGDEENAQADLTDRILTRMEDDQAAGDGLSGNPI
jgi:hypothetical protein